MTHMQALFCFIFNLYDVLRRAEPSRILCFTTDFVTSTMLLAKNFLADMKMTHAKCPKECVYCVSFSSFSKLSWC